MSWEVRRRSRGGGGNLAEMVDKLEKVIDIVKVMGKCVGVLKVMGNLAEEVAHLAVCGCNCEVKGSGWRVGDATACRQNRFPAMLLCPLWKFL